MPLSNHEIPLFNEFLKLRNFANIEELKSYRSTVGARTILQELAMLNDAENLGLILKALNEEEVKSMIIEKGNDFFGNTPLMWAVANSSIDAALTLIAHGGEEQFNVLDKEKRTPLMLSIIKGRDHVDNEKKSVKPQSEIISTLLTTKAHYLNINEKDDLGRTVLHYAFFHQDIDTIILLIKNGAIFLKDKNGQTPEDMVLSDRDLIKNQMRKITSPNTIKQNILAKEDFLKELNIQLKHNGLTLPAIEDNQKIEISNSSVERANAKTEFSDFLSYKRFLLMPSPIDAEINLPVATKNIQTKSVLSEHKNPSDGAYSLTTVAKT